MPVSDVKFEAEVIGHRPPFMWKLWVTAPGVNVRNQVKLDNAQVQGSSDTFEEAVFEAQEAAKDAYERWLRERTKEFVEVLVAPEKVERESDMLVAEPPRRPSLEMEPQLGEGSD